MFKQVTSYQFLLAALLLVTSQHFVKAQNLSTEGRDFWFGFMNNWDTNPQGNPIILEVYISAEDSTSGILTMPSNASFDPVEFDVVPGVTTRVELSSNVAMAGVLQGIESKGIHIVSEDEISVFAMNKRQYSADVAVILPTFSLSNEYLVMSHWEDGNRNNNENSNSEFLIVATAENTNLSITPSVNTLDGYAAGENFEITLDAGESYLVMARGDLTGSQVMGINNDEGQCSNFALFAGNQYTQVGECDTGDGHDHLFAQQYPLKTWGQQFITVNYEPRQGGDIVKVLAQENNTSVNIAGETVILSAGESVKRLLDGVNTISADKPIAVGQFSRTQACDDSTGDPFFILLSPNEQLLSKITFNAPGIATTSIFSLNVIAPVESLDSLTLDGAKISSHFVTVPGNSAYAYARFSINGGNHTIDSEKGFIAYVYGYGNNESFGYSAGAGLANLRLSVEIRNSDGILIPIDAICHDDVLEFRPVTEDEYDAFEWDFGDGSTTTSYDYDPVYHSYDDGIYTFQLTGIRNETTCSGGNERTEVRILEVINPQLPVRGPRSVCPFTENVLYITENTPGYPTFWFVSGGRIINEHRDSIRVNWDETSNLASVKLLSEGPFGCVGDTTIFPVTINLQLDPEAPIGEDTLCSSDLSGNAYSAYYFAGSRYDWQIERGTIVSGQGSENVIVDWEGTGTGKLWYHQWVPGEDICEGTSDTLNVRIWRNPDPELTIIGAKAHYQMNETAELIVQTDTLYHLVDWSVNDEVVYDSALLNQPFIYKFTCPGRYTVSAFAYDTLGFCEGTAIDTIDVSVIPPNPEIINVTNDTSKHDRMTVTWRSEDDDFGIFSYFLIRNQGGNPVTTVLPEQPGVAGQEQIPTDVLYSYKVGITEQHCEQMFFSVNHSNMVLEIAEVVMTDQVVMEWNPYAGWKGGVEEYELYLSVDNGPYNLLSSGNETFYEYQNKNLGLDHCFRVRAIERAENKSTSWSNEVCVFFAPELYAYNVFTPNDDAYNQTFVIDNVEMYRESKLIIMDRSGKVVFEKINYQNDWTGNKLPSGVYFFHLQLNEPRAEKEFIKGIVTIIR